MERYGIEWEQLDTHNEHLSVMDFKKQERAKEVAALEVKISEKRETVDWLIEKTVVQKNELDDCTTKLDEAQDKLEAVRGIEHFIMNNASRYDDDPEYQLTEPKALMSVKNYHINVVTPLVRKLKEVIRNLLLHLIEKTQNWNAALDMANNRNRLLKDKVERLEPENEHLRGVEKDYGRVRRFLGGERTDEIISEVKAQETTETQQRQRKITPKNYER